jgi:hypothetical protein
MPTSRVFQAVESLAVSSAPIQVRLSNAGMVLVFLRDDEFADAEARATYRGIMDALTTVEPVGEEGSLRASTTAMSDDEARDVAERILALDAMCRPLG